MVLAAGEGPERPELHVRTGERSALVGLHAGASRTAQGHDQKSGDAHDQRRLSEARGGGGCENFSHRGASSRVLLTRAVRGVSLERTAVGVGLRPPFYGHVHKHAPAVGFFEVISENFLDPRSPASAHLARIADRYPIVLHGVTLNLLGPEPLDEAYLDQISRLADRVRAPYVTDHLCWTGAHGVTHHDLLPVPYTEEIADLAAERATYVQRRLGRPFGLENLSSYVELADSTMTEWEFYTRVVQAADVGFMLDVNNVYVSSVNHGFDPRTYIDRIEGSRVLQIHLAGHSREPSGLIVDTHDAPVCDEVWDLYRYTWQRLGPVPTLVEWDAKIPPMPQVLAELDRAREVRG